MKLVLILLTVFLSSFCLAQTGYGHAVPFSNFQNDFFESGWNGIAIVSDFNEAQAIPQITVEKLILNEEQMSAIAGIIGIDTAEFVERGGIYVFQISPYITGNYNYSKIPSWSSVMEQSGIKVENWEQIESAWKESLSGQIVEGQQLSQWALNAPQKEKAGQNSNRYIEMDRLPGNGGGGGPYAQTIIKGFQNRFYKQESGNTIKVLMTGRAYQQDWQEYAQPNSPLIAQYVSISWPNETMQKEITLSDQMINFQNPNPSNLLFIVPENAVFIQMLSPGNGGGGGPYQIK